MEPKIYAIAICEAKDNNIIGYVSTSLKVMRDDPWEHYLVPNMRIVSKPNGKTTLTFTEEWIKEGGIDMINEPEFILHFNYYIACGIDVYFKAVEVPDWQFGWWNMIEKHPYRIFNFF